MRSGDLEEHVTQTVEEGPIRAPAQARSRDTMDRILKAFEALLAEKPFDHITIQELAQSADTGTSSIYARFRDKKALVFGLHAGFTKQTLECIDQLADPDRWSGQTTERIVAAILPPCLRYYRENSTLLKACMSVADEPEIRERHTGILKIASRKFSALFPADSPRQESAVSAAVDFSVMMVGSVMSSVIMFGDNDMDSSPASDRGLARYLSTAITVLIEEAQA